jgi:hypothetical protein
MIRKHEVPLLGTHPNEVRVWKWYLSVPVSERSKIPIGFVRMNDWKMKLRNRNYKWRMT